MTSATRKTETQNITIEITLTRKVSDKVVDLDGDRINSGREIYENYEVKITGKKSGRSISVTGKPGGFAFFSRPDRFSGQYPAGAYARIGDSYIDREVYDLAMTMIAALDTEVKKTDEQVALEQAIATKKEMDAQRDAAEDAEYIHQIKNGLCLKCGTYCYGDCTAN